MELCECDTFICGLKGLRSWPVPQPLPEQRQVEIEAGLSLVVDNPGSKARRAKRKLGGAGSKVSRKAVKLQATMVRSQPELSLRVMSGSIYSYYTAVEFIVYVRDSYH